MAARGSYIKKAKGATLAPWTIDDSLQYAMSYVAPKVVRTAREFAEQEVRLPKGPRKGMTFSVDYMPLTGYILDAINDNYWSKIAIVACTQTGKSLLGTNIPTLYYLAECEEDVIFGLPDMSLAKGMWQEKIRPVLEFSKYSTLLPQSGAGSRGGMPDAIYLQNGAVVRFMGAGGGDAQRSSHTARIIIMTEVDKMDDIGATSDEADPVSQIEMRADAFADTSKIIMECTVTNEEGRIWQEAMVSGSGGQIYVPCPKCNRYQTLIKEQLVYDGSDQISAEKTARYECIECAHMWTDLDRREALMHPVLAHRGQEVDQFGNITGDLPRTRTFGIHYNVLYSPMQSIGKTASQQLDADNSPGTEKKKAMQQSKWALPWSGDLTTAEITYKYINERSKLSEIPLVLVPEWMEATVLTCDVQQNRLYWLLKAFKRDHTNQTVDYGTIMFPDLSDGGMRAGLDELYGLAQEGWRDIRDFEKFHLPDICLVDSGYRPDVIRDWIKGKSKWHSLKGIGKNLRGKMEAGESLFSIPKIVDVRRTKLKQELVWFVDVDNTKALVHDRILLEEGSPGYTYIPNNLEKHYITHLTAEKRVYDERSGQDVWQKAAGRRRNDFLDCESYAVAGNYYLSQKVRKDERVHEARVKRNEVTNGVRPARPNIMGGKSGHKTGSHHGGGYKNHMFAPPVDNTEAVDLDEIKDEIENEEFKIQVPSEEEVIRSLQKKPVVVEVEEVIPETLNDTVETVVVEPDVADIKRVTYVEAPKASDVQKNQFGAEFYFTAEGEKIFVSGSWRRCPRCGALDTKNIRNQDVVMGADRAYIYHHRQCTRPVCKHRFKAMRPN